MAAGTGTDQAILGLNGLQTFWNRIKNLLNNKQDKVDVDGIPCFGSNGEINTVYEEFTGQQVISMWETTSGTSTSTASGISNAVKISAQDVFDTYEATTGDREDIVPNSEYDNSVAVVL